MRLTLLALIGALCFALSYALDTEENNDNINQIGLLDVADQGQYHANEGDRDVRQWGGGGYGRRGWGGGGWGGRGGWGGGGWGGRGGWGGGYGGRGGWGGHRGGWGR